MYGVLTVLFILTTIPGAWVFAASAPAAVSVDQLVAEALQDNPQLAALRAGWEAMQAMPAQQRAWPNPMVFYKGMDTANRFPGTDEQRYEVEQVIPWPSKPGLRARMAEQDAAGAQGEYADMRREVARMVREMYYELGMARQSMAILEEDMAALNQMVQVVQTRYATGGADQPDVAMARSELPMRQARQLEWRARAEVAQTRLNALRNRPSTEPLALVVAAPVPAPAEDLDPLLAAAQANRPEIKAAGAQVARGTAQHTLMRQEYLPDFAVGFEYRQVTAGDNMAMFMVGLDLPVWYPKNAAGVIEAERRIAAGQSAIEAARRDVEYDVRAAWARLRAARDTLALYDRDLLPQAEARYQSNEAGYRDGKVDFMDLLESERFLLNARLMRVMAAGEVGMQQARLDWAVGGEPDDSPP